MAVRAAGGDLMVTVARGGDSPFLIPESAECLVERRTVQGESARSALDEVRPAAAGGRCDRRARRIPRRLEAGPRRSGGRCGNPAGRRARDRPDVRGSLLDGGAALAGGMPDAGLRAVGWGLHATDEWVDLRQVRALAEALPGVLREWADARRAD